MASRAGSTPAPRWPQALATAVNGDFVPRAARATLQLKEGDAVFTFQPITGG
jgi:sulfur carrier protein